MVMSDNTISPELEDLLRGALSPWDARSWESLREAHPEAAAYLLDVAAAGGTAADIRAYCDKEGYSRGTADWLAHAVEHLRRTAAAAQAEQEPAPRTIDLPDAPVVSHTWPGPEQATAKGRGKRFTEATPPAGRTGQL